MRFIGGNCGNAPGRRLARCLEAPGPLGSDDSSVEILRVSGAAGDLCYVVGGGVWELADRARYVVVADGDGDRRGLVYDAQQGRFEAGFFNPFQGPFWRRGLGGCAVWEHGYLAWAQTAFRPR